MSWKSENVWITENTTTTIVTGFRSARATCQKRCQPLAPPSDPASCRSVLIVCSPARSVMAKNGMPRHVFTTMAHHMPYVPSERNGSLGVEQPGEHAEGGIEHPPPREGAEHGRDDERQEHGSAHDPLAAEMPVEQEGEP